MIGLLVCKVWVGDGAELEKGRMLKVIGKVVDVGEWSITVNLGRRDGAQKGMLLEILRSEALETDASTGRPAVVGVEKIAEMKVVDVDEVGAEAVPVEEGTEMPAIEVGDEVRLKE